MFEFFKKLRSTKKKEKDNNADKLKMSDYERGKEKADYYYESKPKSPVYGWGNTGRSGADIRMDTNRSR